MERRAQGNINFEGETIVGTTESQTTTYTALSRIAWKSSQDRRTVFHSLMHHINVDSLANCYQQLDGNKAVGTDGITKGDYGDNLEAKLEDLIGRMKRMAYRPGPVRQVLIPKEGKPGATRPLGISNFEDKLVQKRVQEIMEAIYDPIFLDCSYGFRPKRGCHDAVKALDKYLSRNEVETVIDVDLANFFGTIDHELVMQMLALKIKDSKFLRYIKRMFKAGMLANGELTLSDEGVPQGSCCSPVFANMFAHYVIDEWFNEVVKRHVKGPTEIFRYADDFVICCRLEEDAHRIKQVLKKRLEKYKLRMNEDKTKLVKFSKRQFAKGVKQGTFDFLGFTFYLGNSRRGRPIVKLKTSGKRLRSKLKKVNQWARKMRNRLPLAILWKRFRSAILGHIRYYAVSHNGKMVAKFVCEAERIMFKWLNRRSQKKSFDWVQFGKFLKRNPLPPVIIYHKLF